MEKSIISTGKTIDAATEAALERLGLDRDSVSVEVLETPRSGFFGIGATPAKIKVTYEAPDEVATPAPALSSASRNVKPSQFERLQAERQRAEEEKRAKAEEAARQAAAQLELAAAEQPKAPREPKEPRERKESASRQGQTKPHNQRQPRREEPSVPKPREPKPALPEYVTPEPGSVEAKMEEYLNGLLQRMGSEAKAQAVKQENDRYHVELVGEKLGMLIGRRGETLDAIQHLTNYAITRGESRHMRVTVDAENYRAKREESLEHLAYKVADKVLRYRRNWTMEPMNAYERHVIHAALQEYDGVSTYSTGTEPNRRVVVAYGNNRTAPESRK